jgi:hypothetical protein
MRDGNHKLNVIPAQAGTQVPYPLGFGQLGCARFLRGSTVRDTPHSCGPVTWAPAIMPKACLRHDAGVTPAFGVASESRHT